MTKTSRLHHARRSFFFLAGAFLLRAGAAHAQGAAALSTGTLTSDYLEFRSTENVIIARGHAVLISSGTRLESDEIRMHTNDHSGTATGHVILDDGSTVLLTESMDYDSASSTAVISNGYIEDE